MAASWPVPAVVVERTRHDRVLVVALQREEKRNAVDEEMALGIDGALNELEDDDDLWVGILTGTASVFSAGTDLRAGSGSGTERGGPYGIIRRTHAKPLIAAVEGIAFGGGMEMVLACDLVVAARTASFGLPEVKRGLLALYGGVFRSARVLPLNVAKEIVLTGDPIDAARAERLGLVNVITEPGAALDGAMALAARICANSPVAVRQSLQLLEACATDEEAAWPLTDRAMA
ncbi:MAG: enoyl-CoA hydratase-related protein, partial [Acidimicrobiales bacterium]